MVFLVRFFVRRFNSRWQYKRRRKSTKFHQYFDWSEPLSKAPSHRLLAMLRNEGFVKLKIELMLMPLTIQ
jgi:transcriptional accessory protein Tex/SPT6